MILLIDNYDSFTFNLVHYLGELGETCHVVRNDALSVAEALALSPRAIVLSPGPCSPNEAGICCDLIEAAKDKIPVFGVCLGYQAIGQVFGAKVVRSSAPMHGKTSFVFHKEQDLFANIPSPFLATRYHSLVLEPASILSDLEVTAWTQDHVIMGVRHRHYPVSGVQFHPESMASEHGHDLLRNFLEIVKTWYAKSVSNGSRTHQ